MAIRRICEPCEATIHLLKKAQDSQGGLLRRFCESARNDKLLDSSLALLTQNDNMEGDSSRYRTQNDNLKDFAESKPKKALDSAFLHMNHRI